MKEDSETPFTFNPSVNPEDEKELEGGSFFSKNKKIILILAGCLLAIIIFVVVMILIFKGKGSKNNNGKKPYIGPDERPPLPDDKPNNNYLLARFNIPENLNEKVKIFSTSSSEPNRLDYNQYVLGVTANDKPINLTEDDHYLFEKAGNYTIRIFMTEETPILDNFFFDCKYLVEVDFGHLDMKKIASMIELFEGCINLKKLIMDIILTLRV
jgi:hypothetical protein